MKRVMIVAAILMLTCVAFGNWQPFTVQRAIAPLTASYVWGGTPLDEVDVSTLADNMERAQYIRAAASRQYRLIELYTTGEIELQGYTFIATAATVQAIKVEFAALRTRMKACQDLVTAN